MSADAPELKAPKGGSTVLDRVHQAMILFAAGRSEALKSFLVDEGIGKDARFWKLAQSLSALYPPGIDEKRWVDGVLAGRKGSVSDGDSQPDRSLATPAVTRPRIGRLGEAAQGGCARGQARNLDHDLTGSVVAACRVMGWRAAARGHLGDVLPVARNEYLALDVIAFSESEASWPLPVAVFELENSKHDVRSRTPSGRCCASVPRSSCLRLSSRREGGGRAVGRLTDSVIGGLSIDERRAIKGETSLIIGTEESRKPSHTAISRHGRWTPTPDASTAFESKMQSMSSHGFSTSRPAYSPLQKRDPIGGITGIQPWALTMETL